MYKKIILITSLVLLSFVGGSGCFLCSSRGDSKEPMIARLLHGTSIKHIRYKNWMWDCFVHRYVSVQVGDTLFVSQEMWEKVIKEKRETWLASLIAHESTHASRQSDMGLMWFIYYAFSPSFRWDEEKIASVEGWRVYVKRGERIIDYHLYEWAVSMSGPTYNHMVTYEEAYNFAREAVRRLLEDDDAIILTNHQFHVSH